MRVYSQMGSRRRLDSALATSLCHSQFYHESLAQGERRATQTAQNQLVAASQAQAEHNRNVLDLSHHQAKQVSSGETHSHGTTASQNKSFQKLDNLADRFAKDHSISHEDAAQLLSRISANASVGVGFKVFGNGATSTLSTDVTTQGWHTKADRATTSAARDYVNQSSFQDALNQASQAAHDLRYSELSDTGKRYISGMNAASEKSHQYRNEASASLARSESFSKMASWTEANAGSINANLNQEYVNWLQQQELPNSRGAMGITEAQNILSNRSDLDHGYQKCFLEGKMRNMEHHLGAHGLPRSERDVESTYQKTASHITPPVEKSSLHKVDVAATQAGVRNVKIDAKIQKETNEKLSLIQDRLDEQQKALEKQAQSRKREVPFEQ